ncbi:MAG: hypothetical protein ACHBN1_20045 [Heteroscytonema crispum UTEX LB 1556]
MLIVNSAHSINHQPSTINPSGSPVACGGKPSRSAGSPSTINHLTITRHDIKTVNFSI